MWYYIPVTSQEFLYYSLAIGFIILVGFISFTMYHLAKALESLKVLIDNIEDTAKDINIIKNRIKLGALTGLVTFLRMFLKRR
jgi:hypothetical protein